MLIALLIALSIAFGATQNVTELDFDESQPGNITDTTTPIITPKLITNANTNKDSFSSDEEPAFTFEYKTFKKSFIKNASITENETIETFVYDSSGKLTDIEPEIEKIREGKLSIKLPKERAFRAGIYKLKVELVKNGVIYTQEQDFTWGVLAINTHKSIYLPDETAFIGIAACVFG